MKIMYNSALTYNATYNYLILYLFIRNFPKFVQDLRIIRLCFDYAAWCSLSCFHSIDKDSKIFSNSFLTKLSSIFLEYILTR